MKIEDLLELPTHDLDELSRNPAMLEAHLGWTLSITRPTGQKQFQDARKVQTVKSVSPKKLQALAKEAQLDSAKKFAMEQAAKLGIKLEL